MQNFRSWYIRLSPKTRQILVILLSLALLMTVLAIFQKEPVKRDVYDKKRDQITNVLTDTSNRSVGLDNMAGQIRRLNQQNEKLAKEVERLRLEQMAAKEADQQTALARQLSTIKAELEALQSANASRDALSKDVSGSKLGAGSKGITHGEKGDSSSTVSHQAMPNPFSQQPLTQASLPQKGSPKPAVIRITVVEGHDDTPDVSKEQEVPSDAVAYIPAGSILTGTIITGADFPTSKGGMENPTPTLIRLQKEAILPNRYRSDIRECFLLVGGRGELASERAKLRGEMLSCVRKDGAVIETKLNSYVTGEDGKEGVKGRLVSKQGQMIARSLVAGFASGMSKAFDYDPVPVIATDAGHNTQYQQNFSSDAMRGSFAKGASTALERVADFYMDLAEEMFPVVEINAGRQVDVVVISGTRLKVTADSVDGKARQ